MILTVADDISGAAEVAAIGRTFGLTAKIQMKSVRSLSSDLVVVDTDTRYRQAEPVRDIEAALANYDVTSIEWHYKKVDSVLRGNVSAELYALMQILQKNRTILAPANPTKARTISNGQYFINGRPLHETDFGKDPEYPVKSSRIKDLLNVPDDCPLHLLKWQSYTGYENGIIVAEVQCTNDLDQWTEHLDENTLAAGGSDFFKAILGRKLSSSRKPSNINAVTIPGKKLFVCGSASENSKKVIARANDSGILVCPMPHELFNNAPADNTLIRQWSNNVTEVLTSSERVIIAILQPSGQDLRLAESLRIKTAALVQMVLDKIKIHELFIEGGATAEAVLRALQYENFDIIAEYSPGVVQMRACEQEQYVTIKPGSYTWPNEIWT
jgi:uncharacterized protein YgbK (DUF1537 family)